MKKCDTNILIHTNRDANIRMHTNDTNKYKIVFV